MAQGRQKRRFGRTAAEVREGLAADVPYGVTVAAAWSWRFVITVVAIGVAIWLFSHISILVIPLLIAALLSSLLHPLHIFLTDRAKFPVWLSVLVLVLGLILVVVGLFTMAGQQLADGFAQLADRIYEGVLGILASLESWGIVMDWEAIYNDVAQALRSNSDTLLSGALSFGSAATNIGAGAVMALFALVFFLGDGGRIWNFFLKFFPRRHRRAIDGAVHSGWISLGSYVRVQIFVAFVDAVGIGVGAFLLGVPLALPLGVLVFLGSFIPMIGAVLTGAIAVILALVVNGFWNAIAMLAVVLIVQQAESHLLQPLIMGKAVQLHPLAVFLAVAGGTAVLGIVGAIFAVPAVAFANSVIQYLNSKPWMRNKDPFTLDESHLMVTARDSE